MIASRSGYLTAATPMPKLLGLCELGLVKFVVLFQGFQEFLRIEDQAAVWHFFLAFVAVAYFLIPVISFRDPLRSA